MDEIPNDHSSIITIKQQRQVSINKNRTMDFYSLAAGASPSTAGSLNNQGKLSTSSSTSASSMTMATASALTAVSLEALSGTKAVVSKHGNQSRAAITKATITIEEKCKVCQSPVYEMDCVEQYCPWRKHFQSECSKIDCICHDPMYFNKDRSLTLLGQREIRNRIQVCSNVNCNYCIHLCPCSSCKKKPVKLGKKPVGDGKLTDSYFREFKDHLARRHNMGLPRTKGEKKQINDEVIVKQNKKAQQQQLQSDNDSDDQEIEIKKSPGIAATITPSLVISSPSCGSSITADISTPTSTPTSTDDRESDNEEIVIYDDLFAKELDRLFGLDSSYSSVPNNFTSQPILPYTNETKNEIFTNQFPKAVAQVSCDGIVDFYTNNQVAKFLGENNEINLQLSLDDSHVKEKVSIHQMELRKFCQNGRLYKEIKKASLVFNLFLTVDSFGKFVNDVFNLETGELIADKAPVSFNESETTAKVELLPIKDILIRFGMAYETTKRLFMLSKIEEISEEISQSPIVWFKWNHLEQSSVLIPVTEKPTTSNGPTEKVSEDRKRSLLSAAKDDGGKKSIGNGNGNPSQKPHGGKLHKDNLGEIKEKLASAHQTKYLIGKEIKPSIFVLQNTSTPDMKLLFQKVYFPIGSNRRNIEREKAQFLSLSHNNLLKLNDVQIDPEAIDVEKKKLDLGVVYEDIEATSLREYIIANPGLAIEGRIKILINIALAIDYLHGLDEPLIHKQLDPHSILFDREGNPIITNYFIQHPQISASADSSEQKDLSYTSPEQLQGDFSVSGNLYSLGCIVAEILTGKQLWEGMSQHQIAESIKDGQAPDLSKLKEIAPKEVFDVVSSCLNKNANERPKIEEMINILDYLPNYEDIQPLSKDYTIVSNRFYGPFKNPNSIISQEKVEIINIQKIESRKFDAISKTTANEIEVDMDEFIGSKNANEKLLFFGTGNQDPIAVSSTFIQSMPNFAKDTSYGNALLFSEFIRYLHAKSLVYQTPNEKNQFKVLVCSVICGNQLECGQNANDNLKSLKFGDSLQSQGMFHSVHAGPLNPDESVDSTNNASCVYAIYNLNQVSPKYVITYEIQE